MENFIKKVVKTAYYTFGVSIVLLTLSGFSGNLPVWACIISIIGLLGGWFLIDVKATLKDLLSFITILAIAFIIGMLICFWAGFECLFTWTIGLGAAVLIGIKAIATMLAISFNRDELISGEVNIDIDLDKITKKLFNLLTFFIGFVVIWFLMKLMSLF